MSKRLFALAPIKFTVALIIAVTFLGPTVLFAKCPEGRITCAQWCGKYGNGRPNCMSGHPNSCDQKPKGAATCVGDRAN